MFAPRKSLQVARMMDTVLDNLLADAPTEVQWQRTLFDVTLAASALAFARLTPDEVESFWTRVLD